MNPASYTPARLLFGFMALLVVTFISLFQIDRAHAAPLPQAETGRTILVHFDTGASQAEREAVITALGGEVVTWMHPINVAAVRVPVSDGLAGAALSPALPASAAGVVTHVEADMTVQAAYTPNDPDFNDETMRYGLEQIHALDAWDVVTGSQQIIIAVIDSGINASHPEFAGRLVPGYNFIDEQAPDDLRDESGHGTHVAGILAAALDNHQGIAGVCPNCRLMPLKVLNENNIGSWSQLAQGIIYAVDNGARILNLSLGTLVASDTLTEAVKYASERGVIVVAAAGNYGASTPFYPAALDGVIGVGATTQKGERWHKSNFGSYVDLVAPGYVIYSTYNDLENAYGGYTYMNGTSMAAPFVSGVAGLLLSIAPGLSAANVMHAMVLGAEDLGPPGWDVDFGFGRVDALGALTAPVAGLVDAVGEISNPQQQQPVTTFLPSVGSP